MYQSKSLLVPSDKSNQTLIKSLFRDWCINQERILFRTRKDDPIAQEYKVF